MNLLHPFIENHDLLTNFDANYVDPIPARRDALLCPSDKTLPYLDSRITDLRRVVTAAQSGLGIGRGLVRTDKNNLAPRVGLAFRLSDKSVHSWWIWFLLSNFSGSGHSRSNRDQPLQSGSDQDRFR